MRDRFTLIGLCAASLLALGCARSAESADGGGLPLDLSTVEEADLSTVKGGPKPDMRPTPPDLLGLDLAQGELPPPPDLLGQSLVGTDTCAAAPEMTPGVVYTGQDTTAMSNDYNIGGLAVLAATDDCIDNLYFGTITYDGRDAAYRVTVPAGKTLKVTMVNEAGSTADLAVSIVDFCELAALTCLAASDLLTGTEVAQWKNTGTSSTTVFVIVDAYDTTEFGRYNIKAELL